MKAGHSKLDGYSATLPAMRPSARLPAVVAPLPPPFSSRLCAHTYALLPTASPIVLSCPPDTASLTLRSCSCVHTSGPTPSSVPPYLLYIPSLIPLHPPLPPPPLSPASIAPLAVTSPVPAISWLSKPLPPACKAGKTLLLDAFKLSSMAVPYLLSLVWGHQVQNIRIRLTENGITPCRDTRSLRAGPLRAV